MNIVLMGRKHFALCKIKSIVDEKWAYVSIVPCFPMYINITVAGRGTQLIFDFAKF